MSAINSHFPVSPDDTGHQDDQASTNAKALEAALEEFVSSTVLRIFMSTKARLTESNRAFNNDD